MRTESKDTWLDKENESVQAAWREGDKKMEIKWCVEENIKKNDWCIIVDGWSNWMIQNRNLCFY